MGRRISCLLISALSLISILGACGARETIRADGAVSREIFFGPSMGATCGDNDVIATTETTVGFWARHYEAGLGVHSQRAICPKPDCQVVFWVEDGRTAEAIKALALDLENICASH